MTYRSLTSEPVHDVAERYGNPWLKWSGRAGRTAALVLSKRFQPVYLDFGMPKALEWVLFV